MEVSQPDEISVSPHDATIHVHARRAQDVGKGGQTSPSSVSLTMLALLLITLLPKAVLVGSTTFVVSVVVIVVVRKRKSTIRFTEMRTLLASKSKHSIHILW